MTIESQRESRLVRNKLQQTEIKLKRRTNDRGLPSWGIVLTRNFEKVCESLKERDDMKMELIREQIRLAKEKHVDAWFVLSAEGHSYLENKWIKMVDKKNTNSNIETGDVQDILSEHGIFIDGNYIRCRSGLRHPTFDPPNNIFKRRFSYLKYHYVFNFVIPKRYS